jgi:hypothetical protein
MNEFTQQIGQWQWFYATVSTVAATLAGLLFVSLSVNRDATGEPGRRRLGTAQRSFGDFLYVLMTGLVFLVPHQVPGGLSLALLVLGGARGAGLVRQAMREIGAPGRVWRPADSLRTLGLPAIATVGLLVVAVEILRGQTKAIFGLVIVIAALLVTASWNAWLILVDTQLPQ